ncbi:MAG: anaerobic ribonucleoside-triphosphate reductase activating protein [Kiritimatiellae bacterium]|nr:anaerobic ribonucleoside-triphosphate reductase activating protein [Kiritimatiellia bacterium]
MIRPIKENNAESPVCAFLPHPSLIDFPSHLAAVFFLDGCNFRCRFCHNASLIARQKRHLTWEELSSICSRFRGNWVDAAVLTGGEPTLAADLEQLVRFFKDLGWAVKLDTNGSNPAVLKNLLPHLEYIAMDVKAAPARLKDLTGFDKPDQILASVSLIRETARDYEFRTTIIPSIHTDEHLHEIGAIIAGTRRYAIQPFVPRTGLPDPRLEEEPRPTPERLSQIRTIMSRYAEEVIIRGT